MGCRTAEMQSGMPLLWCPRSEQLCPMLPVRTRLGIYSQPCKLWEDWDDADIRKKKGSIIDCLDKNEMRLYLKGGGNASEETYYINKNIAP